MPYESQSSETNPFYHSQGATLIFESNDESMAKSIKQVAQIACI